MANTPQQAYDAIKALEAEDKLPFPGASITKLVGVFDATTSKFQYSVPTLEDTSIEVIEVNGKPKTIKKTFVVAKVVAGPAANLLLEFLVRNPQGPLTVSIGGFTATAAPGQTSVTVNVGPLASIDLGGGKFTNIYANIWSGNATTQILLRLIRAPIVGAGAFTIPALPLTLIYAPPPGAQNKNFAEYTSMNSISSKLSGSVSSGTSTKTSDAFTTSDFLGKLAGLVGTIGGKNEAAGSMVLGLNLLASVFPDATDSNTNALTTTTEHDLQTTDTDTTTTGTPAGLGPGLGDRFVYLRNVRVVWLIADGALSYTVLGTDGIRAFPAQVLSEDLVAITASSGTVASGPVTNLDAVSLRSLLSLDPFVGNAAPALTGPRFVQNDPASAGGSGTDPNGDSFTAAHDISTTDITTQVNVSTTISDFKPGWLVSLFGDAEASETQMTFTYQSALQKTTDHQQSVSVHFFASQNDPSYLVGLWYDRLFGTFAFTSDVGEVRGRPPVVSVPLPG
jgi:hypothetical protein